MTRRARELETLLLTMFAAFPLYLTHAIGILPLVVFHAVMTGIVMRVAAGKGPELIPARVMRWLAVAYVPFYILDAAVISRSAIAASTHLVLFIALYQPIESAHKSNQAQRMLTTALIFVASLATSTHISVVLFVIAFAFLMFRQLMYVSHLDTVRAIERPYAEAPSGRAAAFYLTGATVIGAALFPFLPRVSNPFVQGITGSLPGASTALSETIDFNEPRTSTADATVVARVWMDEQARPFFTPIRLRGNIYDRYYSGEWRQSFRGLRHIPSRDGVHQVARPGGIQRQAVIQTRAQRGKLFLPSTTFAVANVSNLFEGPSRETYYVYSGGMLNLDLSLATQNEPMRLTRVGMTGYAVSPEVAALAHRIVGNEQRPEKRAQLIEQWMLSNFRYVPNPANLGQAMTVDQFLLRDRAGHCEYFAAGMVVLLNALEVPARIAGGFYGGRYNPLTGYYAIRRDDAHAWTEVWDGTRWVTFDATPPSLRPGTETASAWRAYLAAIGDSVTYFWDRYILTFGLSDQINLAEELITWTRDTVAQTRGRLAANARALASADFGTYLAITLTIGLVVIMIARQRRPLFAQLAIALQRRGIRVEPGMTVEEALHALPPEMRAELEPLVRMYEEEQFSGRRDARRRRELRRKLAELST